MWVEIREAGDSTVCTREDRWKKEVDKSTENEESAGGERVQFGLVLLTVRKGLCLRCILVLSGVFGREGWVANGRSNTSEFSDISASKLDTTNVGDFHGHFLDEIRIHVDSTSSTRDCGGTT